MNSEFLRLKQQIEQQNQQTPLFSKLQRKILQYQRELREAKIEINFKAELSELSPERAQRSFGPHQYTFEDYFLEWVKVQENFTILIHNKKVGQYRPLIDTPNYLQEQIVPLLEGFCLMLYQSLQDLDKKDFLA